MTLEITQVETPERLELFRGLLREYAAWLHPVTWRGLEHDIANLPGKYTSPGGMWLGFADGALVGSVALRFINQRDVEIKRLFVRQSFRGRGYARALSRYAIAQGAQRGFDRVVLQVVKTNTPAIAIYRSLGFVDIASYDANQDPNDLFLGIECKK